ncbi:MAG: HNH endonuclease, partial [Nitrososphaera sp.]|nr:HNH endonuclease [Nitrososphaera sp.]
MLHLITMPSCYPALEWIVQLQQDLLAKLCDPATTAAIVTPEWVAAIRPDCSDWLKEFAQRTYNTRHLTFLMGTIASASVTQKSAVLTYFETSHAFTESFDSAISSPQLLSDVQTVREAELVRALRVLLEAFYEIALRNGLPRNAWGNSGQSFDRNRFVEMFKEENYGRVCPLCDGDMNGPEVDHWLPKSKYPALSCHPKNLVPVCHRCNSRECKGEKSPLDIGVPRPFDGWFHPYERPAHGNFSVRVNGSRVSLMNGAPVQQKRLDNFDGLVKLTPRWSEEYKSQTASYLKQLRDKVRRKRIKPAP